MYEEHCGFEISNWKVQNFTPYHTRLGPAHETTSEINFNDARNEYIRNDKAPQSHETKISDSLTFGLETRIGRIFISQSRKTTRKDREVQKLNRKTS